MFNKKNNTSHHEFHSSGKNHPFIKKIKNKLIADRPKELMKLIIEDLKTKNFVFSNN